MYTLDVKKPTELNEAAAFAASSYSFWDSPYRLAAKDNFVA
ncbi:hypothetical protein [Vibrio crassostreae]|nr:hypothetical protein [Vibrio crassostreae]